MSDQDLRALERRIDLEPSDQSARLAYGLALVRAGRTADSLAFLRPESGLGYGALARAAAAEPGLDLLLDGAPEWRGSGGDEGLTRWSRAEPVRHPRLAWRRRLENAHACLALAVDRGRAFVVVQADQRPLGGGSPVAVPELRALSVLTGETLWRQPLGSGPAAAPVAREGVVFAASLHAESGFEVLRTYAFSAATGQLVWGPMEERDLEVSARGRLAPGALNLAKETLVLPVPISARGVTGLTEARRRSALVRAVSVRDGLVRWSLRRQQVGSEVAILGDQAFVPADATLGDARILRLGLARGDEQGELRCEARLLAAAGRGLALAGRGELSLQDLDIGGERFSSQGGSETSLAFDGERLLLGRGTSFVVRSARTWDALATWQTAESPLGFSPKGVVHLPPAPRSAVVAGSGSRALAYLASPLAPSISAYSVETGEQVWRFEIDGLLVPEEGPRLTWPILEVAPPDRGPLYLAPLPGRILGVTLSGYAFLLEES